MDKRTITGFVLIALILFGFAWWQQPSAEQVAQQRAEFVKDSIASAKKAQTAKLTAEKQAQLKAAQATDTTALFYAALNGKAQDIILKNSKVELTLSTKGGVVKKAVIKNYIGHNIAVKDGSQDQKNVTLFSGDDQSLNFMLAAKNSNIETKDLIFTPSNVTDSTVTFTAVAGKGKTLTLNYTLGKDYLLNMSLQAEGMGGLFAPNYNQIDINWQERCKQQERGFTFENRYATLTYKKHDGGTDYLSETSEKEETTEDPMDWVAFKNQFFSAVMIAKDNFATGAKLKSTPLEKSSHYLKHYEANMKAGFDPTGKRPSEFEFYFGPNDFRLLQSVETESKFAKELDMERLVYLGWPLFRIINRWFTLYVFDWLSKVFPMGVVLILITLLLKLITFPMVKKSYMSSAKMRVLKPKLDEATKQFNKPEDQMQKQHRGQSFLWMDDLSTYDPIFSWGHDVWLVGDHISLTCILFCGANLLYTWFTMQQQKDQMVGQQADQMKMMQWMMFGMPLFFFFMFNDYSSLKHVVKSERTTLKTIWVVDSSLVCRLYRSYRSSSKKNFDASKMS